MSFYHVTQHAAERWAQHVMGYAKPQPNHLVAATQHILEALETARSTKRLKDKARIFVTPLGWHLIVGRGGVVYTVLAKEYEAYGCPCEGCVRKRALRIRQRPEIREAGQDER